MGRENYYKPGSFYRVDDRTGFTTRAERTRMEWDRLIVREQSWERRQPQDFVRGVRDDQTVPEPRPRQAFAFDGPAQTTLSANVAIRGFVLPLTSVAGFFYGDKVSVILNDGTTFLSLVLGVLGNSIAIGAATGGFSPGFSLGFSGGVGSLNGIPVAANAGNLVTDWGSPELQPSSYPASG